MSRSSIRKSIVKIPSFLTAAGDSDDRLSDDEDTSSYQPADSRDDFAAKLASANEAAAMDRAAQSSDEEKVEPADAKPKIDWSAHEDVNEYEKGSAAVPSDAELDEAERETVTIKNETIIVADTIQKAEEKCVPTAELAADADSPDMQAAKSGEMHGADHTSSARSHSTTNPVESTGGDKEKKPYTGRSGKELWKIAKKATKVRVYFFSRYFFVTHFRRYNLYSKLNFKHNICFIQSTTSRNLNARPLLCAHVFAFMS